MRWKERERERERVRARRRTYVLNWLNKLVSSEWRRMERHLSKFTVYCCTVIPSFNGRRYFSNFVPIYNFIGVHKFQIVAQVFHIYSRRITKTNFSELSQSLLFFLFFCFPRTEDLKEKRKRNTKMLNVCVVARKHE